MSEQTTTRSYRPGGWFGVLGARTTVLLPPSEKARVAALWELVDDGADGDDVLDALVSGGLRTLPAFVLATTAADGSTRLLLRGQVRATVAADGETVEVDGAAATTWVERSWVALTALSVVLDEREEGPELVAAEGLVRLSRLEEPAAAPDTAPDAGPVGVAVPDAVDLPPVSAPAPLPLDLPPPSDPPPGPVTAPVSARVPDAPAPEWTDHDGETRAGLLDPATFERRPPGIPGQPPAPPVTARPVARLVLSDGTTVDVDRAVLIGRAPEARRFTANEQPRLVTVASPQHEISSTHLEVRPGSGADHGLAVVTDLGSTNGTVLVQPGLGAEDLRPGIAVQLVPGAVIDLGDGVAIQVTTP